MVTAAVLQAIDGGALRRAMARTDDRQVIDALAKAERKLLELREDYDLDRISRAVYDARNPSLKKQVDLLRRQVETVRRQVGVADLPSPLTAAWPGLSLHRKQAVLGLVVEKIVVKPATRGRGQFDGRRIEVMWKV